MSSRRMLHIAHISRQPPELLDRKVIQIAINRNVISPKGLYNACLQLGRNSSTADQRRLIGFGADINDGQLDKYHLQVVEQDDLVCDKVHPEVLTNKHSNNASTFNQYSASVSSSRPYQTNYISGSHQLTQQTVHSRRYKSTT